MLTQTRRADDLELFPATVEPDAWDQLFGMTELKWLIERRVLLPLDERDRARRHGLTPPAAMLLFGPPGTGKTALARAVAGRLGRPFAELDLSRVAVDATRLRQLFDHLCALDEAVVFFDEFEHLGLRRGELAAGAEPLTAELLRGLPALRGRRGVLAVCATNYVRLLDPALLRPGRFDLMLPVGPPDAVDRLVILRRLLASRPRGEVDLEAIAARSDGLTQADLAAVCDRAAHAAFEREVRSGRESRVETADLLLALAACRPTLDPDEAAAFREDALRFARV